MTTEYFEIQETVINGYKVTYDKEKLKKLGFNSLKEYCKSKNETPFGVDDMLEEIKFKEIVEYVDEWEPFTYENVVYWGEDNE